MDVARIEIGVISLAGAIVMVAACLDCIKRHNIEGAFTSGLVALLMLSVGIFMLLGL
jgi:hypothetical protein